jgi:molybdopterin-guanine dinucleotide biosynthesis protein A
VIPDVFHAKGPMAGIHACLRTSSNEHNVVISVDTPFAGPKFINYLFENRKEALVAAPWYEKDHYEPLLAYYNKGVVPHMEEFFNTGNFKLPDLFQSIPFTPLQITAQETFFHPMLFHNINTEQDLQTAEAYLKKQQ